LHHVLQLHVLLPGRCNLQAMPGNGSRSWFLPIAAGALPCIIIALALYLRSEVLVIIKMAAGLRERRYETGIILGFFVITALVIPLCIVPSGLFFLMACILAYVYGLAGWFIAWPAFSCGLMLVFFTGRGIRNQREDTHGVTTDFNPDELPDCLQGKTTSAILRGSRRLLREQPKRTTLLLTFALHSPSVQFLLGYASSVSFADNLPACSLDGSKSIVPILKGLVLADIVDLMASKHEAGQSVADDWRDYSTAFVKLVVCVSIGCMLYVMAKAAKRELDEADEIEALGEQEHLLSRRFSAMSTVSEQSQVGRIEPRGVEEGTGSGPTFRIGSADDTPQQTPRPSLTPHFAVPAGSRSPRGERKGKVRMSVRSMHSVHSSATLGSQAGRFEDDHASHSLALPPSSSSKSSTTRK